MRRRREPLGLISRIQDDRGGIALEASIVLPVFLFIVLFLMLLIRMSLVQMALQDTAAQAAKLTAAHIRPAALTMDVAAGSIPSLPQTPLGDIGPVAAEMAGKLPEPAGPLIEAAMNGDWQPIVDMSATAIGQHAVLPLVRELAPESVLKRERIRLDKLSLPDIQTRESPYFYIRLTYSYPLGLPFTKRAITLSAAAEERAWVSDAAPAATEQAMEGEAASTVAILAIEPAPLRPGRKAKVIAAGRPNETLSLQVRYKSGTSKAKHLGEATADENGVVSWEWHVSGNTTPGIWELIVTSADGASVVKTFEVRKRER